MATASSRRTQLRETADVLSQLERVESICVRDTHGEIEALYGELFTEIEIGGRTYTVPAGSFFQSNFQLLPKLLDRVRELATLDGSQRVADIYGGIGLLGLSIADQAASLTIIEIDELATEAGERTAQNWGLNNVSFHVGVRRRGDFVAEGGRSRHRRSATYRARPAGR